MSKFCGLASMQQQTCREPAGQECKTLDRNSKMPSSQAWLINKSQSKPSGCRINAQLTLPASSVTGMYCPFTVWMLGAILIV